MEEPPAEIKKFIETTASFVAKLGLDFQNKVAESEGRNPNFNFLRTTDVHHAYYQNRIRHHKDVLAGNVPSGSTVSAAPVTNPRAMQEAAPAPAPVAVEVEVAPKRVSNSLAQRIYSVNKRMKAKELEPPVLSDAFVLNIPEGVTAMDLDIMKLTAQFIARNGHQFHRGLMEREHRNPQFDFLRNTSPLNGWFYRQLLEAYNRLIHPPRNITTQLKESFGQRQDLLDRIIARYQTDKEIQEKARIEKEREDETVTAIDWHDFVVIYTIDFQDEAAVIPEPPPAALPPPPEETVEVEMETEDMEIEEEPVRRPSEINIRKDYVKGGAASESKKYQVCPKCGQEIAVEDMDEHMRIELMDPRYRIQRMHQMERNKGAANFIAVDDEIGRNLQQFAAKRADIFGDNQTIQLPREEEKSDRVIWDGHSASIHQTTAQAQHKAMMDPPVLAPPPVLNTQGASLPILAPPQALYPPAQLLPPNPMMAQGAPPIAMGAPTPVAIAAPVGTMGTQPVGYGVPQTQGRPLEAPTEPAAKAPRVEENMPSVSEDEFMNKYPANVSYAVLVRVPEEENKSGWKLQGQTLQITVLPRESVTTLKDKIAKEVGIPANKQKLQFGSSHLADGKNIAFYNLGPGTAIDLRVKARGGKKA